MIFVALTGFSQVTTTTDILKIRPLGDQQILFNEGVQINGETVYVWDYTNKRLGVNKATPLYTLDVAGTGRITSELNLGSFINFGPISTPANPSFDNVKLYMKSGSGLAMLDAAGVETLLGAGGGGAGTITSITAGNGMDFTTITVTGPVTLGLPSSNTSTSSNAVTTTSHTHQMVPPGPTTSVIFNDAGAFGYSSGITYNKTIGALTVGGHIFAGSDIILSSGADRQIYINGVTGEDLDIIAGAHLASGVAGTVYIAGGTSLGTDGGVYLGKTSITAYYSNVYVKTQAPGDNSEKVASTEYVDAAVVGGAVGGTGTINYHSKWTAATTLGDAIIYDNGTLVTIEGGVDIEGNITFDDGADRILKIRNQTVFNNDGDDLYIQGADGFGTAYGGEVHITGGAGSIQGSDVYIYGYDQASDGNVWLGYSDQGSTAIGDAYVKTQAPSDGSQRIASTEYVDNATGSSLGGSGTLNYISKWTPDGTTLGNSIMVDNGTQVIVNGDISLGDDYNILIGASSDISIYHESSTNTSFIESVSGNDIVFKSSGSPGTAATMDGVTAEWAFAQSITLSTVNNLAGNFLTVPSGGGIVHYRTPAQVATDLGVPIGTGTTDYITRWLDANTITIGSIRDDSTTVSIGAAPNANYKFYTLTAAETHAGYFSNAKATGTVYGIEVGVTGNATTAYASKFVSSGTNTDSYAGYFLTSGAATNNSYSGYFSATGASVINYAGYFTAINATSENYAIYSAAGVNHFADTVIFKTIEELIASGPYEVLINFGDTLKWIPSDSIGTGGAGYWTRDTDGNLIPTTATDSVFADLFKFTDKILTDNSDGNIIIGDATTVTSLTTGASNYIQGIAAGDGITDGDFNIIWGEEAANLGNSEGAVIIGHYASAEQGDAQYPIVIGNKAGYFNDGYGNIYIGYETGYNSGDGVPEVNYNTMLGTSAGKANVGGDANFYGGYLSGTLATGSNNLMSGAYSGAKTVAGDGQLVFDGFVRADLTTQDSMAIINGQMDVTNMYDQTLEFNAHTTISKSLTVDSIPNEATDVDKFLVSNGGNIRYRTGVQVLSDIGAGAAGGTVGGTGTVNYLTKWSAGGADIEDSQIRDDATTLSIGAAPLGTSYFYVNTSTIAAAGHFVNSFAGSASAGIVAGIVVETTGAGGDAAAGIFQATGVTTNNIAGHFIAANGGTNFGIYSEAIGVTTTNMAGYFIAANGGTNFGIYSEAEENYFSGTIDVNDIPHAVSDLDKFLVSNGGVLEYRTGAEVLSDIGGSITGSGTQDYLVRWSTSSTLDDGASRDDGTNFSIGEAIDATARLNAIGNLAYTGRFENTATSGTPVAVYGLSSGSGSDEGHGGLFESTGTNTNNVGATGSASGATTNYGLQGEVIDNSSTTNYGVKGSATGTSTINYGGHFSASGATTNYGIYSLLGKNYFQDTVIMKTVKLTTATAPFNVLIEESDTVKYVSSSSFGTVAGTGTADYSAVWQDATTLTDGIARDNGSRFAINQTLFPQTMAGIVSDTTFSLSVTNDGNSGEKNAIYGIAYGTGTNKYAGRFVSRGASTVANYAGYFHAYEGAKNYAIWSQAGLNHFADTVIMKTADTSALSSPYSVMVLENDTVKILPSDSLTGAAGGGTVTNVSSATTSQLTVANSTTTPALTIVTGAVINGGTPLATGDQIYDFVIGLGYSTTTGTVTEVTSATPNYLTVATGTTTPALTIVTGIANTNIVRIDYATVVDNDYAKFTANGLEGRSYVEVLSDIGAITGNESITLSGDVSGIGTTAITTVIGDDKILESMLKSVNVPTDEYILTYEATTGDFEWQTGVSIATSLSISHIPYASAVNVLSNGPMRTDGTSVAMGASPTADKKFYITNINGTYTEVMRLSQSGAAATTTTLNIINSQGSVTTANGINVSSIVSGGDAYGIVVDAHGGTDNVAIHADRGLIRYDDIANEGTTATKIVTIDASGNLDYRTLTQIGVDGSFGGGVGTVGGTGTINYLTKWSTGGADIENSQFIDDGSNTSVGIAPVGSTKFYVNTTTDIFSIYGVNASTTGNTVGVAGAANGIGADLNRGGYFTASGATINVAIELVASGGIAIDANAGTIIYNDVANEGTTSTKILTVNSSNVITYRTPANILADLSAAPNTMTTTGDMLYFSGGYQRLVAGTNGYMLYMTGGIPTWGAAPTGSGDVTSSGMTQYYVPYATASKNIQNSAISADASNVAIGQLRSNNTELRINSDETYSLYISSTYSGTNSFGTYYDISGATNDYAIYVNAGDVKLIDDIELQFGTGADVTMDWDGLIFSWRDSGGNQVMSLEPSGGIADLGVTGALIVNGNIWVDGYLRVVERSSPGQAATGYGYIFMDASHNLCYTNDQDPTVRTLNYSIPAPIPEPRPTPSGPVDYDYISNGIYFTENSIEYNDDWDQQRKITKHFEEGLLVKVDKQEWEDVK